MDAVRRARAAYPAALARGWGWPKVLSAALRATWQAHRCWSAPTAAKAARVLDRDLLLTYRGEDGKETARCVRIVRVRRVPDGLVVEAHCRLRDAPRRFRVDRLTALADPGTGRKYSAQVRFAPTLDLDAPKAAS